MSIPKFALRAVLALLAALVLFLVGAFIVLPKIMGWVPLTVLTGSMRPHIPPGSEIVVARVETPAQIDALRVGDVVSYMPYPDDPMLITHRIVAIAVQADGQRVFTIKGDANPSADPNPVTPQQIRGKLLYHVPWLGYVTHVVPQSGKGLGLVLTAVALLGYAGWQIVSATLGSRRSRSPRRNLGRHRHRKPERVSVGTVP